MKSLDVANIDVVGGSSALDERLSADGYLFFRGVLDKSSIALVRDAYVAALRRRQLLGLDSDKHWTGNRPSDYKSRLNELHNDRIWERFVASPQINSLLTKILGDEPWWIPVSEYRAVLPVEDLGNRDIRLYAHQDSYFTGKLGFRTLWIPLCEIDDRMGGLALAPGMHNRGLLHDIAKPPSYNIPSDAVPQSAWRGGPYSPGDLVMFHQDMPHSGLVNQSDGIRMSMDLRCQRKSDPHPIVGTLTGLNQNELAIQLNSAEIVQLAVDETTYFWNFDGGPRLTPAEAAAVMPPGCEVVAERHGAVASVVRLNSSERARRIFQ